MTLKTFGTIFRKPIYVMIATLVAISVFSFAVWLPNLSLIGLVLSSEGATSLEKLSFLFSLFGSISTNFTVVSASYTIAIAILFGVNISLLTFYIRRVRKGVGGIRYVSSAGIGGLISGLLGVGCAACGTFILSSVLALIGAGGILAYLPFKGEEFGLLGVGLLIYSVCTLVKKINAPLVC